MPPQPSGFHRFIAAITVCGVTITLLGVVALLVRCAPPVPDPPALEPTPGVTRMKQELTLPPTELALTAVFDITSSADRYADEAKALLAAHVAQWPVPGRGALELSIQVLNSKSWDAASIVLTARLEGLPARPIKRQTMTRPAEPDFSRCNQNAFGRGKCVSELTDRYNVELRLALEDDALADAELQEAMATFEQIASERHAQATALAETIVAQNLGRDPTASDVSGALLRASESFSGSPASRRAILIQSDFVPSGRQQPGTLALNAIAVIGWYFDCPQASDCQVHQRSVEEKLLSAGALSVRFLDPARSRLSANILEEIR